MGLQQGFATDEMGSDRHFAWQQSSEPNVRFVPKADIRLLFDQLISAAGQG
jgi:hypothetical protein